MLQQVGAAYRQGVPLLVVRGIASRYDSWNDEERAAADRYLESVKLPPMVELLLESRMHLSSTREKAQAPSRREAAALLVHLHQRLADCRKDQSAHPALQTPPLLPADFSVYRRYIDDLHYLGLQAQQAAQLALFADQLALPLRRKATFARLEKDVQAVVEADYQAVAKQWSESVHDLEAASLKLRVQRLVDADSVLRLSGDPKERFLAAYVLDVDGPDLQKTLMSVEGADTQGTGGAAFDWQAAQEQVANIVADKAKLVNDLGHKARLLEEGVAWWLRGRYGIGPLANGRMKRPGKDLLSRLTLLMPVAPVSDAPTSGSSSDSSERLTPMYPRRHHYMWQQDNRRIRTQDRVGNEGEEVLEHHSDKQIFVQRTVASSCGGSMQRRYVQQDDYTYRVGRAVSEYGAVLPNDPEEIYRQAGYIEYSEALRHFDELLPLLNGAELEAVEDIVRDDPRLVVEVNLSRHLQPVGPLAEKPLVANDDFRRHGLPWVIALARVEVAGVLAAMTDMPNPFLNARITRYERAAYHELVTDGFRAHFYSLPPAGVWEQVKDASSRVLLAFHRRLTMTLQLAETSAAMDLPKEQRAAVQATAAKTMALRSELEDDINKRLRSGGARMVFGKAQRKSSDPTVPSFDTKK